MPAASPSEVNAPSDHALLQRVQQENQRRILGKLLHDLRNPVHSLRITIELFSRLVRRSGDVDVLTDRAARYVAPAEAALNSLIDGDRAPRPVLVAADPSCARSDERSRVPG